jgi:FtsZ-binding cell division protein ZapB
MTDLRMTVEELMKKEIAEMQSAIHTLQMRVKELKEENTELRKQLGLLPEQDSGC